MATPVVIDGNALTIDDVFSVAARSAPVTLAPAARERAQESRRHVEALVQRKAIAYGVTTGFGKLSNVVIPIDRLAELQVNLIRSHASGVGDPLPQREVRAMMLLRANVIATGLTGARPELADLLIGMLNAGLHPQIPEQGSVGASGDLAPLAHLALAVIGEGELHSHGASGPAARMLAEHGLTPATLRPKEGIVLINGTQAHTAAAALAVMDAHRLWKVAHIAGAM